jgi:cytochrome c biogenesis protein CcmG, thiol:disulfide interchange protein DsbE
MPGTPASSGSPCKDEIPAFQDVYEALGNDVVVLGVNLEESASQASGILDVFRAKYPALLDSEGKVANHYRVTVMPTTYFIDRDGVVRALQFGEVRKADLVAKLKAVGIDYTPK